MTKAKSNVHRLEFVSRDTGYRFRDRDPALEELCDLIDKSGLDVLDICRAVVRSSKGSASIANSTIYNWLNGKTKRPQSYGMNWVGFALGYERKWRKI